MTTLDIQRLHILRNNYIICVVQTFSHSLNESTLRCCFSPPADIDSEWTSYAIAVAHMYPKVEACLTDNTSVALPLVWFITSITSDLRVTRLASQFGVTRPCRTTQLTSRHFSIIMTLTNDKLVHLVVARDDRMAGATWRTGASYNNLRDLSLDTLCPLFGQYCESLSLMYPFTHHAFVDTYISLSSGILNLIRFRNCAKRIMVHKNRVTFLKLFARYRSIFFNKHFYSFFGSLPHNIL